MSQSSGDYISGSISGNVSGQVAVGKNIAQTQRVDGGADLTDDERQGLAQLFADLRSQVAAQAPPDQQQAAVERAQELEEALTADEPDLTTVQYVKGWFLKRLPDLAGIITGILVNPVVGKLVQSGGDAAVERLARVVEQ
jgi:uncharacterized membrane protein YgcG